MLFKKFLFIFILALSFINLPSLSLAQEDHPEHPEYIVATTSQIGDLLKNILGDSEKIDFIMGPGIDPHLYRPTRSDMEKLLKADIIFYNGMNLEGKMEDLFHKLEKEKPVIAITDALEERELNTFSKDGKPEYDPHIWMNVANWIAATNLVKSTLSKGKWTNILQTKTDTYIDLLKDLDEVIRKQIATIPEEKRVLVTAHDAFGYLGSAYGLDVIGIQGISTESEAGIKRIEEIVDILVERKIPAVFIETSVGDHNIKAIIEGAAAMGHKVTIGGHLYSDAMGEEDTPEGTYIGMMKHNVTTITNALNSELQEK
ncbi:MAG: zinc ABC transporter substrate-binding protein [Alphaproteobacteria bacterium]|nr:zinc ABC transporter substrate-binding protein [Alphaproteobacteria bacterium]